MQANGRDHPEVLGNGHGNGNGNGHGLGIGNGNGHGNGHGLMSGTPAASAAARCSGSDLLRWLGMAHEAGSRADQVVFPMRRVRTGTLVVHEGAPLESLYFISAGTFKSVHTDPDGYELVQGFLARGDVIGLDGLSDGVYGGDAIALEDATVAIVTFRELISASRTVPALEQLIFLASGREIRRKNHTLEVMAAVGAEVRLARFLLQLISRQVEQGYSARRMVLRMSRRDIASHLGIAHETVSRSLTALADWGYIGVNHREIEILDGDGLERFKRVTRGPTIKPPGGRGGATRRARIQAAATAALQGPESASIGT